MTWLMTHSTPNISVRRGQPQAIILHHTGGREPGDLAWLCNKLSGVSADFLIARNGNIYKLNPDITAYYTYHAGVSALDNLPRHNNSINISTIGIEMSHLPGELWPIAQVAACARLCRWLEDNNKVTQHKIVSHRAVALPAGRKMDPENFPWSRFSELFWGRA